MASVLALDSRGERFTLDTDSPDVKTWDSQNSIMASVGKYNKLFLFRGQWFHRQGDTFQEMLAVSQQVNYAHYISPTQAADWFLVQKRELPSELAEFRPKDEPAIAIPRCPGCNSPPATIEVDDVCPECGGYLFRCGIAHNYPLGSNPTVFKQQVHFPRWDMIAPSQVSPRRAVPGERRKPSTKGKVAKKTRRRKSRAAILLLALLEDRTNANLNCSELARILKVNVSSVSRAFRHREYGPQIMKRYQEYGVRPPGIHQI